MEGQPFSIIQTDSPEASDLEAKTHLVIHGKGHELDDELDQEADCVH